MTPLVLAFTLLAPTANPTPTPPFLPGPSYEVPVPPPLPPAGPPAVVVAPSANWAAAQLPCPQPMAHPFQRLPRICPVIPCVCGDGSDGHGDAANKLTHSWTKDFHQAAHFPLPRYAIGGSPQFVDGLLIYEGMRLTVYNDGTYDLAFTATVPEMPVTIRLQLVFTQPGTISPALVRQVYRITLPPLRLEPKRDARPGDPTANTFQVAHRGYSSLFVVNGTALFINSNWDVTRIGTARFGTAVAVEDSGR